MRKESIGRLLLSLITAFVMVVGVFAAALYNNAVDWENESSSVNSNTIAPSGKEIEKSEVGEAPTSASNRDNNEEQLPNNMLTTRQPTSQMVLSDARPIIDKKEGSRQSQSLSSAKQTLPEEHGTRIAPGAYVDAGGPYGTPSAPLEEGDSTFFWATIHDDVQANYEFRWDIDDDGYFESDWSANPYYFHTFTDNHIGEARVQAFDGTYYTVPHTGIPLQEDDDEYSPRYYYSDTVTWGWEFSTSEDIRITDLGFLRDSNVYGYMGPAPEYVYKLTIWDAESWTRLVELEDANGFPYAEDTWNWFSVSPAYDLPAGSYMMSCHAEGNDPMYPNLFPGIENPFSSPDGVVEIGDRYIIDYDYYPYWWDGHWSSPAIDFKYEWDEYIDVYLEDTADVYVANVAPDVSDAHSIPPDAVAPEGSPVEFTASFKDPGAGDEWLYRFDWGDGEVSDWMKVPHYSFEEPFRNVLYYYDGPGGRNFGGKALNEIGLEYTEVSSDTQLEGELESGVDWDLVVVQNPYNWMEIGAFEALNDYVEGGGKLIINTWLTTDYWDHPLWNNLGAYFGWDYVDDAPDIYEWDMSHDIFNYPNDVPTLVGTDMYTWVCGQYIQEIDGVGHPVAGYYPTDDPYAWYEAGLIARLDKQTIWNAFTPCNYNADEDGDGNIDMQELFVNEIVWILGGTPAQPWPDAQEVPPVAHIFKDDHPDTKTDMDQFHVTIELKDDDYMEGFEGWGNLLYEDFEDISTPELPPDWTMDGCEGWETTGASWHPDYDGEGYAVWAPYWYYYGSVGESSLYPPEMDASLCHDLVLDFDWYWQADGEWLGLDQDGYVEISNDGGGTWTTLWEIHVLGEFWDQRAGHETIDISTYADGQSQLQIRFRMDQYDNYWWELDHIKISGYVVIPGVPGKDTDDCWVTIQNVFPELYKPAEFVDIGKENGEVNFGVTDEWGFTITDPALMADSETFWYKIDFGDGTATEWKKTQKLIPGPAQGNVMVTGIPMDYPLELNLAVDGPQRLMYNYLNFCFGDTGTILCSDSGYWMESFTVDMMEYNLNSNFGTNYDFIYAHKWVDLVDDFTGEPIYDMLYFSYDWTWEFGDIWYTLDEVTEYVEAGGHVFVPGDENLNGPIYFLPWYVENQVEFLDEFPGPAYTGLIEDIISDGVVTGYWGFIFALHNTFSDYDPWEFIPVYADPSPTTTLIRWGIRYYPKNLILPETHIYGDNGKYEVNIMIIDDDMWWDLSGEQPVFDGPPGSDPNDWISNNKFEVNIENADPEISSVSAHVHFDACLRVSGTKDHTAYMELKDHGVSLGPPLVVERDPGAPDFDCAAVDLDLTKGHDYEVEVTVDPGEGGGGNPTWIFQLRFPDGKIKEFKHTFNDEHGWTWTITHSEIMRALLGHDIIFEATASDSGSDDLAYLWNFGDCTPHGIHLYANSLYTPAPAPQPDPVEGESDEAVALFDQLGEDRDPYFDYYENKDKSPDLNPIEITDMITHIFDENQPYYYYVTLIVIDDDVEEPYPSTQSHPINGIDIYYIELDLG